MTTDSVDTPHEISIALWDVSSPVIEGRQLALKVGVACSLGCKLAGAAVDVYDEAGTKAGGGTLGAMPLPETAGLYWAALEVGGPRIGGAHVWTLRVTVPDQLHSETSSTVPFVAVGAPEHRVAVIVIDKDSRAPLDSVELRLGMFRARTDDAGAAQLEVGGGTYELAAWKHGYDILSQPLDVAGDMNVELEMTLSVKPEQPYWM